MREKMTKENRTILLHGFPDGKFVWKPLVDHFSDNQQVVAINISTYGDRPNLRLESAEDFSKLLVSLEEELSANSENTHLVGHDLGGILTWHLASRKQLMNIKTIHIMNAPHPSIFNRLLKESDEQKTMSQYIRYFQKEGAAKDLKEGGIKYFQSIVSNHATKNNMIDDYKDLWSKEGWIESALSFYKVYFQNPFHENLEYIDIPTFVLWGKNDSFLSIENLDGLDETCNLSGLDTFDAGHWCFLEETEAVASRIKSNIQKHI